MILIIWMNRRSRVKCFFLGCTMQLHGGKTKPTLVPMWFYSRFLTFCSSFPDLLFDIVKEVMAEFISERVESFFGFGKRRSSSGSDAGDWIGKIINIVRRKALNQSKGCLWHGELDFGDPTKEIVYLTVVLRQSIGLYGLVWLSFRQSLGSNIIFLPSITL